MAHLPHPQGPQAGGAGIAQSCDIRACEFVCWGCLVVAQNIMKSYCVMLKLRSDMIVVSVSLYGDKPKYCDGAIEMAKQKLGKHKKNGKLWKEISNNILSENYTNALW